MGDLVACGISAEAPTLLLGTQIASGSTDVGVEEKLGYGLGFGRLILGAPLSCCCTGNAFALGDKALSSPDVGEGFRHDEMSIVGFMLSRLAPWSSEILERTLALIGLDTLGSRGGVHESGAEPPSTILFCITGALGTLGFAAAPKDLRTDSSFCVLGEGCASNLVRGCSWDV